MQACCQEKLNMQVYNITGFKCRWNFRNSRKFKFRTIHPDPAAQAKVDFAALRTEAEKDFCKPYPGPTECVGHNWLRRFLLPITIPQSLDLTSQSRYLPSQARVFSCLMPKAVSAFTLHGCLTTLGTVRLLNHGITEPSENSRHFFFLVCLRVPVPGPRCTRLFAVCITENLQERQN